MKCRLLIVVFLVFSSACSKPAEKTAKRAEKGKGDIVIGVALPLNDDRHFLEGVEMAIEEGGYLLRRVLYGASGPTGEHRTNNEDDDDRGNVDNVLSTLKLLSESFDSDLSLQI